MIIQIRGTSGSGKTYVMREVMRFIAPSDRWSKVHVAGRKQPLYYRWPLEVADGYPTVSVLGHYETACGGCDNIGSAKAVTELLTSLEEATTSPQHILCEGLLLSEDTKWTVTLSKELLRVLFLNTDLETCLQQVRNRRVEAGNEKPLNPENTANRVAVIERARLKLIEAGVTCRRASARQAPDVVLDWLNLGGKK